MGLRDYPSQDGRHGYVVLKGGVDTYVIVRDCPECGEESRVTVPGQGLWDWEHGAFVQTAFPTLTSDEREQVKTGIHGPCWEALFSDDYDETEYDDSDSDRGLPR